MIKHLQFLEFLCSLNILVPKKGTKIYAGDTIYVPRHERFSYYWPYIKDTVSFITGLATSVVVIKGLVQ